MSVTNERVICMSEMRLRRKGGLPPPPSEWDPVPDRALVAAAQEAMQIADLARRVEAALRSWPSLRPHDDAGWIRGHLPVLVGAIRAEPGFTRETASPALRVALRDRFGEARLERAALMTPQELLALPGVTEEQFSTLIGEFGGLTPLTIPELVTGTGKASLRMSLDGSERVRAMMSIRARPTIGSRALS